MSASTAVPLTQLPCSSPADVPAGVPVEVPAAVRAAQSEGRLWVCVDEIVERSGLDAEMVAAAAAEMVTSGMFRSKRVSTSEGSVVGFRDVSAGHVCRHCQPEPRSAARSAAQSAARSVSRLVVSAVVTVVASGAELVPFTDRRLAA